jgi:cell division septal protein FtsQ
VVAVTGTVVDRPTERPPVDRRIRARRIEVRRTQGRRRLRRLVTLVAASAVVLAAWGVVRSPLLDVDEITVEGAERTAPDELVVRSGIARGDALIDVDTAGAAARVAELPWIAAVDVRRDWSGAIVVSVDERTPDAVVVDPGGTSWLVDADGTVLDVADPAGTGLPTIEGLAPPAPGGLLDAGARTALDLAMALPDSVRPVVASVEVREGETWLRLVARPGEVDAAGAPRTDGGHVRVGDGRDLAQQVLDLTAVLAQVDLTDLAVLDVRVPSNPVVTRTTVATVESEEVTG